MYGHVPMKASICEVEYRYARVARGASDEKASVRKNRMRQPCTEVRYEKDTRCRNVNTYTILAVVEPIHERQDAAGNAHDKA